MQQLRADVMVGPLSGDEAVTVANYAKTHPQQTFVIGTAGSQDPTLQIAPRNVFRYHGDGAQWNAGLGEVLYKRADWRTAAIIMDDYSFGWTSAAGIIADFCAAGGRITKRVFPPLNTTDYAPFVRQLPAPDQVDGYIWVVGGAATGVAINAFEQAYGQVKASQHTGNLFLWSLENFTSVAPRMVGSYAGGFGTAPGLKSGRVKAYENVIKKWYPSMLTWAGNGFFYNYYNAAWALVRGLNASNGELGAALQRAMPRTNRSAYEVSDGGVVKLDSRRQAIQDQYQGQIVRNADGTVGVTLVAYAANVDQTFGGLFKPSSPPPGRTQPKCVKKKLPWSGKVRLVRNGVITNQVIK
jgi:branched-chain amino acid transport system substrate-binding protein